MHPTLQVSTPVLYIFSPGSEKNKRKKGSTVRGGGDKGGGVRGVKTEKKTKSGKWYLARMVRADVGGDINQNHRHVKLMDQINGSLLANDLKRKGGKTCTQTSRYELLCGICIYGRICLSTDPNSEHTINLDQAGYGSLAGQHKLQQKIVQMNQSVCLEISRS